MRARLIHYGLVLAAFIVGAVVMSYQIESPAANPKTSASPKAEAVSQFGYTRFVSLSGELEALIRQYQSAVGQPKDLILEQIKVLAKDRKVSLINLAEADPALAIKAAVLPASIGALPADVVTGQFEQPVTAEGSVYSYHEDRFTNQAAKPKLALRTSDGQRFRLFLRDTERRRILTSTRQARVNGIVLDDNIIPRTMDETITPALQSTTANQKRLAVFLINFTQNPSQPYTKESISTATFGSSQSIAAYFREVSYQKVDVVGDVFGWYTLSINPASCAIDEWASAARAAAQAAGITIEGYDHYLYAFTSEACPWRGLGDLRGKESWVNERQINDYTETATHELGHNFGFAHAASLRCKKQNGERTAMSGDCQSEEYGDPHSVMGAGSLRHLANFAKGLVGWLDSASIQTITKGGTYALKPVETGEAGPKALLIKRGRVPVRHLNNRQDYYYFLEYRQPFGFDNYSVNDPAVKGVFIRLGPDYDNSLGIAEFPGTFLLDMTPRTISFADAPLGAGRTYIDTKRGIKIKTLETNPQGAQMQICFEEDPCYR